jgi:hypothetical protein
VRHLALTVYAARARKRRAREARRGKQRGAVALRVAGHANRCARRV